MTFEDFLTLIVQYDPAQRVGQFYMNMLVTIGREDLYKMVRDISEAPGGYPCDPFYSDHVLPVFFKVIEENW